MLIYSCNYNFSNGFKAFRNKLLHLACKWRNVQITYIYERKSAENHSMCYYMHTLIPQKHWILDDCLVIFTHLILKMPWQVMILRWVGVSQYLLIPIVHQHNAELYDLMYWLLRNYIVKIQLLQMVSQELIISAKNMHDSSSGLNNFPG